MSPMTSLARMIPQLPVWHPLRRMWTIFEQLRVTQDIHVAQLAEILESARRDGFSCALLLYIYGNGSHDVVFSFVCESGPQIEDNVVLSVVFAKGSTTKNGRKIVGSGAKKKSNSDHKIAYHQGRLRPMVDSPYRQDGLRALMNIEDRDLPLMLGFRLENKMGKIARGIKDQNNEFGLR
ncbi:hypothetical protein M9H77_29545 [Catharanthus roseus]|uniref:Uncharacterized protein n=1 Tax=Catharanthus roseus TaxID=4058 RepID=A0ACB9ZYY3_CATRO|nr:hypothetical protein M9H77_29545 [Catharanthus roseus]